MHVQAIQQYSMAVNIAVQRPPWEAQQLMREEVSMILSNRSAAFFEAGDYLSALVDAETVIQLKRPWSKGHFRKARALMKLNNYTEAREAIQLGLSFEPNNQVCFVRHIIRFHFSHMYHVTLQEMNQMLTDIESHMNASSQALEKPAAQPIPVT